MKTRYLKVVTFDCGSQIAVVIGSDPRTCLVYRFHNPFFRWKDYK